MGCTILAAKIVMPQNSGGDGAPWGPGCGQLGKLVIAGSLIQAFQTPHGSGKSDIAPGPHIDPPERHEQIDIGGPLANTGDFDQFGANDPVRQLLQLTELKLAIDQLACQLLTITCFLTGDPGLVQTGRRDRQHLVWGHSTHRVLQSTVRRSGRCQ